MPAFDTEKLFGYISLHLPVASALQRSKCDGPTSLSTRLPMTGSRFRSASGSAVCAAVLAILAAIAPFSVSAIGPVQTETKQYPYATYTWSYRILDDGTAEIISAETAADPTRLVPAFASSGGSSSITLPTTLGGVPVSRVGDGAFYGTGISGFREANGPGTVVSYGRRAFAGCTSLASVKLESSTAEVGIGLFENCTALVQVTFYGYVPSVRDESDSLLDFEPVRIGLDLSRTLIKYRAGRSDGFEDWRRAVGPQGGVQAETDGSGITWFFHVDNGKATVISDFCYLDKEESISAISPSTEGRVVVPATLGGAPVVAIGPYAFHYCDFVTEIILPSSLVAIGEGAFKETGIRTLVLPSDLAEISDGMFWNCDSLEEISIPEGVASIGHSAFEGCASLVEISLPASLRSLGAFTFSNCISLTNVVIAAGLETLNYMTFSGCTRLERITLPQSLRGVGIWPFQDCSALRVVTFLGSVPRMADEWDFDGNPLQNNWYLPYFHDCNYDDPYLLNEKPRMFIDYPQTPERLRAAWFRAVGPQVIAEDRLSDDLKAYVTNLVLQGAPQPRAAKARLAAAEDDGDDDPADPVPDITGFVTYATAETIALCRDFGILPEQRVENHTAICDFAPPSVVIEGLDPATGTLDARVVPGTGPAFGNANGFLASSTGADMAGSVSVQTSPNLGVAMRPVDAVVDDDAYFDESDPGLLRCTLPMDGDSAFFRVSIAPTP